MAKPLLLLLIGLLGTSFAQQDTLRAVPTTSDTTIIDLRAQQWPRPNKAALYSVIFPGLGQLYNKDYWKVPIVWAAAGTAGYFIIYNHTEFVRFRDLARDPDDALRLQYRTFRDFHRRNRDFTIMMTALGYALVAVEAYVDAHLYHFDVSDDLSMSIYPRPIIHPQGVAPGLALSLRLK